MNEKTPTNYVILTRPMLKKHGLFRCDICHREIPLKARMAYDRFAPAATRPYYHDRCMNEKKQGDHLDHMKANAADVARGILSNPNKKNSRDKWQAAMEKASAPDGSKNMWKGNLSKADRRRLHRAINVANRGGGR